MKIPRSVRELHQDLMPTYGALKVRVDELLIAKKHQRWHYESRIKSEESFALKLETGRVRDSRMPEDFFACTLVVENHGRISEAEKLIGSLFDHAQRRPKVADSTHLAPSSFDFDDLRLYVRWRDEPSQKPTGLASCLFEIQIKTFLQHAWGIATHDMIYKSDDVHWAMSRIAFQVKAMLEHAEVSIGEAKRLAHATLLNRTDMECEELRSLIGAIKSRWKPEQLPHDLRRLAQNFIELSWLLRVSIDEIWVAVDEATAIGEGAATLNLSPHGAVIAALIRKHGASVFDPLSHPDCRGHLFVPNEVELPPLPKTAKKRLLHI